MAFPRLPKIPKTEIDPSTAPDWVRSLEPRDPYGLGPSEPWLRVRDNAGATRHALQLRTGEAWAQIGDANWRLHTFLTPDRAVVSKDQSALCFVDRAGTITTFWSGPTLVEIHGGALLGDNWMFAAAPLPDGRWLAAIPATEDPDGDESTWVQEIVLFDSSNQPLSRLPLFMRPKSMVEKGYTPRYMARRLFPACGGTVGVIAENQVMAFGIFGDTMAWIGKTNMPRGGGGVWADGEDLFVSTAQYDKKKRWSRLEDLRALYDKKARKLK